MKAVAEDEVPRAVGIGRVLQPGPVVGGLDVQKLTVSPVSASMKLVLFEPQLACSEQLPGLASLGVQDPRLARST
jgi:hypothetical protein